MRLTVKVLPLTAGNAPGPYQAEALAAFQQRVFALPVDAADTFELVWHKIEERYRNNYLAPQHVALFAIKKLQDGRDCDLDLTDTVGSIFGDEAVVDRVVQVVPAFANRLFSMPPDTNLRPNHHKRSRLSSDGHSNKRACHQPPSSHVDEVVTSVESDANRADRSPTGGSVTLLSASRHAQAPFTTYIKSESPELGAPKSPGGLRKPAQHLNQQSSRPRTTPSTSASQHFIQQSSRPRTAQSTSASGNSRKASASTSTSTPYGTLTKLELRDLLLERGLKTQEKGQRNKVHMVQRLTAYDAQFDHTVIQETPQSKGRVLERKHVSPESTNKANHASLQGSSKHEIKASSPNRPASNQSSPSKSNPTNLSPSRSNSKQPSPSKTDSISPSSSGPSPTRPDSNRSSSSRRDLPSPSPTRPDSNTSSPLTVREPAQWLAKSPSPRRLESDVDSEESRASSRSQSPVDEPNGDAALDQDTSNSESDSKSDEEGEVGEKREVDRVDVDRTPSPADPGAPSSAQVLRSSVIPNTQSSAMQIPASQPPPRSATAKSSGGINAWFSSASQPQMRPNQAQSQPASASQPILPKRGPRGTGIFVSLKEMLKQTREQPNRVTLAQAKPAEPKATDPWNSSQKKLPSALEEDSEDDESRDSSSSSSDEDSEAR